MTTTPQKPNDSSLNISPNLTPVRFLDSPKAKVFSDSNVAAAKSRLEVVIKTLLDNYAKWQLAEKRGLALCNAIEAIKTRTLEAQNNTKLQADGTLYPAELKPYCDKLAIIASIFVDITTNAQQTLRQLRSLEKLPGCNNEIFFRSWKIPQFVLFVERLVEMYTKETEVKQTVMRELPHCLNRAEIIRCTTAWEYPQYTDDSATMMFKFLKEEINTNKK